MYQKCLAFISIVLVCSCSQPEQTKTIEITEFNKCDMEEWEQLFHSVNHVIIDDNDTQFISSLVDGTVVDSLLYILDDNKTITCVNFRNGHILRQIRHVGLSGEEYIQPSQIAADRDNVYLFDIGKQQMFCYTPRLEYTHHFQLKGFILDFIKVDKGFLVMSAEDRSGKPIIKYIDDDGELIKQYEISDILIKSLIGGANYFFKDIDEKVYINPPFSNKLYEWRNNSLCLLYSYDYGKYNIRQDVKNSDEVFNSACCFNNNVFIVEDFVITDFLLKNRLHYNMFNIPTSNVETFSAKNICDSIPVCPRWQSGRTLIGVERIEEQKWETTKEGMVLFLYELDVERLRI